MFALGSTFKIEDNGKSRPAIDFWINLREQKNNYRAVLAVSFSFLY